MTSFLFQSTITGQTFTVEASSLSLATPGAAAIVGSHAFIWLGVA